jgi:hypothetical protein
MFQLQRKVRNSYSISYRRKNLPILQNKHEDELLEMSKLWKKTLEAATQKCETSGDDRPLDFTYYSSWWRASEVCGWPAFCLFSDM